MIKIENIYKSPLTSVLGLLIILASVASVFYHELGISWTEASVGIGVGALFLGAPGRIKKVNKNTLK